MAKNALLIGVSQYEAGLPPLAAATKDVAAMLRVLQSSELGAFDEVKTLIDPDLTTMQMGIHLLFKNCPKGDLRLLYFSGHGIANDEGKLYLATRITSKDNFEADAVPASFIQERMREHGYQTNHVLILDCCYSGAFAEGWLAKSADINLKPQLEVEGSVVLTSSTSTQKSYEDKEGELSLYTNYIVQGIESGAAESDGDGMISADELHEYAKRHVQSAKPAMKPEIYGIRQGIKIRLAKARVDAKLEYRRLVEKYADNDEISFVGQKILKLKCKEWGLSDEAVIAIENEVLEPVRNRLRNLALYEQALEETCKQRFPLTEKALGEIEDLQELLGLRDEDISSIHNQIITPYKQQVIKFYLDKAVSLEMIYIPSGKFTMGSPPEEKEFEDERPQIENVNISAFYMGKYQITQEQWQAIMGNNPSLFKDNPQNPVEQVSWNDVQEFCKKLSQRMRKEFRLPSDAEWEYACRAGTTTTYSFGDNTSLLSEYAWYRGNSGSKTHPVGQKKPNDWGLYDMHGNVWEWCQDSYEKHGGKSNQIWQIDTADIKSKNKKSSHRLRGGSYSNHAQICRSGFRYHNDADYQYDIKGFRVVYVVS